MPIAARRALPFLAAIALIGAGLAREDFADWSGRWLVAAGVATALLALAREAARGASERAHALATAAGLGVAIVLALVTLGGLALEQKLHDVPGVGTVWALDDDMMITLRYAANAAAGEGLVWNPGERVEGITNLLWALVLVPPHWLLGAERVALAAIVLNGLLLLAAIALTFRLTRRLTGSGIAATLAALALATHLPALHWAAAGSETILLAVLLLAVALAATAAEPSERALRGACLVGGLALVTRPDALPALVALLAAPLIVRLRAPRTRTSALGMLALLAAPPLAALAFRLAYYGSPLPNTYYLKMTGWSGRTEAGLAYVGAWLVEHPVHVGLALLAPLTLPAGTRRAAAALVAAIALHAAYVAWAGGDELMRQRFFVPLAPLLLAGSLAGADAIARRLGRVLSLAPEEPRAAPLALPALAFALGTTTGGFLPFDADPAGEKRASSEKANVMLGLLIHANTQPDAKVAHFWAGAAPYFARRPAIDFLGKCDPVIARQAGKPGLTVPGHNKYDFAHSLGLGPDVIVGGHGGAATLELLGWHAKTSPYRAFDDLYRAEGFAMSFVGARPQDVGDPERMPQLVGGAGTRLPAEYVDVLRGFHAVFVRAGSARARPPAEWLAPTSEDLR